MKIKQYSIEDPVVRRIDSATHFQVGPGTSKSAAQEDPAADWRMDGLLAKLGPVVAFERVDGGMALSTWDGESTAVWAKFDADPLPDLVYMRKYMVDALNIDQPRPFGFIRVICFTR